MHVRHADLHEILLIEPAVHRDNRGLFLETYREETYAAHGVRGPFVQDNHSRSIAGALRGLHLQVRRPQAKLVRVTRGAIFDVAVDVRRGSPTFGRWTAVTLSADNFLQCYIPEGFGHGFCVVGDEADIEYKCTAIYDPAGEIGIAWNDPALAIAWPLVNPILSNRDRSHPALADVLEHLPNWSEVSPVG